MLALSLLPLLTPAAARAAPKPLCPPANTSTLEASGLRARAEPPRAQLDDWFSPDDFRRSRAFNGLADGLGYGAVVVELLTLALLALRYGPTLGAWALRVCRRRWKRATVLLTAIVLIAPAVVSLPIAIASHAHARAFGLATDPTSSFLLDRLKALGFTVGIGAILALIFIGIARRAPRCWPPILALGAAALTFVFVYLLPVVYEPAFNRFTPVDAATRARIISIAERQHVSVRAVVVADASRRTSALNAYVTGIGSSRRVVLYDTLLRGDLGCELEVVVAHELAHVKHDDVVRGTFEAMAGAALGVLALSWLLRRRWVRARTGAEHAGDPRMIPLILFVAIASSAVLAPAVNYESRRIEASADRSAIEATRCPGAAIRLQRDLARTDLDDLRPDPVERWYAYTHPTVRERIQLAIDAAWGMARDGEEITC